MTNANSANAISCVKWSSRWLCVILFSLLSVLGFAQVRDMSQWSAQWITPEGMNPTEKNVWICYRKSIEISRIPKIAELDIAVDSKYWLWINGKLVVFEGGLKRGPNPRDTYFDRVSVQRHLRPGKNTFAILVWYWGQDGFSHKSSGKAGLVFQLMADGKSILDSDGSWKSRRHPAFGSTSDPKPNYRLPESNVYFDARLDLEGWTDADFDDSKWSGSAVHGRPPVAPWNHLIERPIPQWRTTGLVKYTNDRSWAKNPEGTPVIAKLPRNLTVSPYLKIKAPAGLKIDIRSDNYNGGSELNLRAEYVTKEGIQEFESLPYINGHWIIYSFPKGVEILDLRYRESRFDTDWVGSFECDDPALNTLWMKSRNTMNVNMRDSIQDPDRERAQWWGDVVILMNQILHVCDDRGRQGVRKAILNLVDWQKENGSLYSPIPAGNWNGELPMQMLASIGEKGIWNYYLQTGDRDTVVLSYPAVRKYLNLWNLNAEGLVIHRAGDWDWADWGENIDVPVLENAWLYQALGSAMKMAELTGNNSDIAEYARKRDAIRAAYNSTFWTGSEYRSPGYTGKTDDRGHAAAVVFGLAEQRQWKAIRKVFESQFHSSPYMEKYVLEALLQMGETEACLSRMKSRYSAMIASEYSTLWEGWGIGKEGFGGGSYNHGWSGGPLSLMMEYLAGIKPLSPGYETVEIAPTLGPLSRLDCSVSTPKGLVQVAVSGDRSRPKVAVVVPKHSTAIVKLPYSPSNVGNLFVNGRPLASTESAVKISTQDQLLKVTVPAGKWSFEVR